MLNSLIGIIASSGGAAAATASYESISTVTVGSGGTASITFSSIPSTYQHLQVRIMAKGTRSIAIENGSLNFNGDSGNNYNDHSIYADGSNVFAGANSGTNSSLIYTFAGSGGASGSQVFGSGTVDILDYANTNTYKTSRTLAGYENGTAGFIGFNSGLWRNTTAITSLTLTPSVGTWLQYSSFALYGIKG